MNENTNPSANIEGKVPAPDKAPISRPQLIRNIEKSQQARDIAIQETITIAQYQTACRQGRCLRGKISAVQELEDPETGEKNPFAVIYDGPVTVYIPMSEMYTKMPADLLEQSNRRCFHQKGFLSNSVGAEIPYLLETFSVDEESGLAIATGSRIKGLRAERRKYFGAQAVYSIEIGSEIDVSVLAVGRHQLYVVACGMDMILPVSALTFRYLTDCRSYYRAGDTIRAKIMACDLSDPQNPKLALNAKTYEIARAKRYASRITAGTRTAAVVTYTGKDKTAQTKTAVCVWLVDLEIPAMCVDVDPRIAGTIKPGTAVIFEVNGLRNNGMPHGKIFSIVKAPSV